jgi:hypothetical protein
MKKFVLGVLVTLFIVSVYAFAQSKLTATMERAFARITVVDEGLPADTSLGLAVLKIQLSDGVSCYALSARSFAETLQYAEDVQGFSCVK